MEIRAEKDYMIDGIKSWIHCLVEGSERGSRHPKPIYHNHDYIELLYALTSGAHVWINGACYPFDEDLPLAEQASGIVGCAVRVRWFCITNDIGAVDLNGDVLVADGYLEVEPFPVYGQ